MITEWLVAVATSFWGWLGGLLPDWELPPEIADLSSGLNGIFALGAGLAPFAEWGFVAAVGAIPIAIWISGVAWKTIRMIASHIPLFGGNG